MNPANTREMSVAHYPWSKAFFVASSLWVIAVWLLPSPFAFVLLIAILPLNLILQRVLIHPARRWPVMSRYWVRTAIISVLVFAIPLHISVWSQRTAKARFKQYVLNPIPAGVTDISKREAIGIDGWIILNFALTPEIADTVLRSRTFKVADFTPIPAEARQEYESELQRRFRHWVEDMDVEHATIHTIWDEAQGETYYFILSEDRSRGCFVYQRF
jgi:hypothetical protein